MIVAVDDTLELGDIVELTLAVLDTVAVTDRLPLGEDVDDTDDDGDGLVEIEAVPDREADPLDVGLGLAVSDTVAVTLADALREPDGLGVDDTLPEVVGLALGECVDDTEAVAESVADADGV